MPRSIHGLPIIGSEQITVSNTAKALTKANYDKVPPVVGASVTVTSASINWLADSTTPTSSLGHFAIPTGDPIVLIGRQMVDFLAIRQGSTDAKIDVSYFGAG